MFQPKHFLDLAENLKESPKDNLFESRIRTSIGRSYYSIFLATRYKLEGLINRELEKKRNIHVVIIDNLKKSVDNQIAQFGTNLDTLRNYRLQADYRIKTNLHQNIANGAYALANDLFNDLKNLPDTILKTIFQSI
jgi:uncharacterized protein (UPF0332 family)